MVVIFALTMIGGIGLLGLAVWPGVLEDAVFSFPFFCLSLPLLGCWFLLLIGLAARDLVRKSDLASKGRRWGLRSAAVLFCTLGLLWFHLPQRVTCALCRSELQELVDSAPAGEFRRELGRRIGPYRVDDYGGDRRGGVYFRTHTGPDGIGPNTMSYGFAFQPNGRGTPFENAYYRQRHLFRDWYVFAASNDW